MSLFLSNRSAERGDIAIYTSLLMLSIILSSALVMSLVLVRQLRQTRDAIDSERSFYAANSGLEHGLYLLAKDPTRAFSSKFLPVEGSVSYGAASASGTYRGIGAYKEERDDTLCVRVTGFFRGERRTVQLGADDCFPP